MNELSKKAFQLLAALAWAVCLAYVSTAQGEEPPALTQTQEQAVEAQVLGRMGIKDPANVKRVESLWTLAEKLMDKRAYCRTTEHLRTIEALKGSAIEDNRSFAAQAFYQCANIRLQQGFVEDAVEHLKSSIAIVGERPEHRDLQFKLAVIRARQAVHRDDLEGARTSLARARELGVATGPGANDRLASWALPTMHAAAAELAGWARELADQGEAEKAVAVADVALTYHPRNKLAIGVRQDVFMTTKVMPGFMVGVACLAVLVVVWGILRRRKLRQALGDAVVDDL